MATPIGNLVRDRSVHTVQRTASVFDAVAVMAEKNIGAVAVLDGNRLVGIFSERDVIARVLARQLDPHRERVESVMTRDLVVAQVGEDEESCLRKMKGANCRHLPVVDGDTLVGVLSLRDLLQVELDEREEKLEFLTNYMFHLPPGPAKTR